MNIDSILVYRLLDTDTVVVVHKVLTQNKYHTLLLTSFMPLWFMTIQIYIPSLPWMDPTK